MSHHPEKLFLKCQRKRFVNYLDPVTDMKSFSGARLLKGQAIPMSTLPPTYHHIQLHKQVLARAAVVCVLC